MSTAAIREQLQHYIATADDRKIEALHTILQADIKAIEREIALTPKQERIILERLEAHENGTAVYISEEEHLAQLKDIIDGVPHEVQA